MKCYLCGKMDACIRPVELPVAKTTLRAHVDCQGHSEYRAVTRPEIAESLELTRQAVVRGELVAELDNLADLARTLLAQVRVGQ